MFKKEERNIRISPGRITAENNIESIGYVVIVFVRLSYRVADFCRDIVRLCMVNRREVLKVVG